MSIKKLYMLFSWGTLCLEESLHWQLRSAVQYHVNKDPHHWANELQKLQKL